MIIFLNKFIHFSVAYFIQFCNLGLLLEITITGSCFVLEKLVYYLRDVSAFSRCACDTKICL